MRRVLKSIIFGVTLGVTQTFDPKMGLKGTFFGNTKIYTTSTAKNHAIFRKTVENHDKIMKSCHTP